MWKVAIVDDEPATREGLLRHIDWTSLGIAEVQAAEDAARMLELCEVLRPDIVISDVRMPGMDGIALCRILREKYPKCRIIFLSGYSDKEYLLSAIDLSAVSYVEKPVDIDALSRVIRRAVAECVELQRNEYGALPPALLAQFVAAVSEGVRDDVLRIARQIREALNADPPSTQAYKGIYYQLVYHVAQRGRSADEAEQFTEALRASIEPLNRDELHPDLLARIDALFPVGYLDAPLSAPIRQTISYMERELGNEKLTIDMMAKQVYLAPTYLSNLFKKETGKTVGQFLLDLRMGRAKVLLKDRGLRLYHVARKVGYTDQDYFAKTFRKAVGLSPKEYREKRG